MTRLLIGFYVAVFMVAGWVFFGMAWGEWLPSRLPHHGVDSLTYFVACLGIFATFGLGFGLVHAEVRKERKK